MGAKWEEEEHSNGLGYYNATIAVDKELDLHLVVVTGSMISIDEGAAGFEEVLDPIGDIAIVFSKHQAIMKFVFNREAIDWEVVGLPTTTAPDLWAAMNDGFRPKLVLGSKISIVTVLDLTKVYIDWKRTQS